jgi:hypothetical protein
LECGSVTPKSKASFPQGQFEGIEHWHVLTKIETVDLCE